MADSFSGSNEVTGPAAHLEAITPNDAADLTFATRAIWVGTAGDVKVTTVGGETVTIPNVPSGTRLDVRVARVWATGTDATDLVAMW